MSSHTPGAPAQGCLSQNVDGTCHLWVTSTDTVFKKRKGVFLASLCGLKIILRISGPRFKVSEPFALNSGGIEQLLSETKGAVASSAMPDGMNWEEGITGNRTACQQASSTQTKAAV